MTYEDETCPCGRDCDRCVNCGNFECECECEYCDECGELAEDCICNLDDYELDYTSEYEPYRAERLGPLVSPYRKTVAEAVALPPEFTPNGEHAEFGRRLDAAFGELRGYGIIAAHHFATSHAHAVSEMPKTMSKAGGMIGFAYYKSGDI